MAENLCGETAGPPSNGDECQACAGEWLGCHGVSVFIIVFKITSSFRIAAIKATFPALPRSRSRS